MILIELQQQYFQASLTNYVTDLKAPFENSWMSLKWATFPVKKNEKLNANIGAPIGMRFVEWFLYSMPFIFLILSICLLTGLAYRFALRASAFYMVLLGLGKYAVGDVATTAQDFIFAAFICIGLFLTAREDNEATEESIAF